MPARKPYHFHPEAWAEFEAAADWYQERRQETSIRFLSAVYDGLETIAIWPDAWPQYHYGTRRFILHRFPFSIIYLEKSSSVNVIAVAHHKRKPGYWKDRLKPTANNA